MQRFVDVQVFPLLKNFVTHVAFYWSFLLLFHFLYIHQFLFLLFRRILASMSSQLRFTLKGIIARATGVLLQITPQRSSSSKNRLRGFVH